MTYGSPILENDIKARSYALAQALLSSAPHAENYKSILEGFKTDLGEVEIPVDELTWFAVERLANKLGAPMVRLSVAGTPIPAGAVVMIDNSMVVPESVGAPVVSSLRSASLVVASEDWGPILRQASLASYVVHEPRAEEKKSAPRLGR